MTAQELIDKLQQLSEHDKTLPVYFIGERLIVHAGIDFASGRDGAPHGVVLSDY